MNTYAAFSPWQPRKAGGLERFGVNSYQYWLDGVRYTFVRYSTAPGDTIRGIAARWAVTPEALLNTNPGYTPDGILPPGSVITIEVQRERIANPEG